MMMNEKYDLNIVMYKYGITSVVDGLRYDTIAVMAGTTTVQLE